ADFTQQLAIVQERHSEDLQILVENFRKRNAELRKDRSSQSALFTIWELLLQEVEVDSQLHGDIARTLNRKLGTVLLERTFHRKIQSRKAFLHRESLEAILSKAEELLLKCQKEYFNAYQKVATSKNQHHLPEYYESHNSYVQQLHASNGMLKQYQNDILPMLLEVIETYSSLRSNVNFYFLNAQELRDVYIDISDIITNSMESTTDFIANKVREQCNHYQTISNACRSVNANLDLTAFIKTLNPEKVTAGWRLHTFTSPALMNDGNLASNATLDSMHNVSSLVLQNEIVIDRTARISFTKKTDSLRQEIHALELKIQQLEETLDSMVKLQQRSLGSNLLNKANEIQEDISLKRFDIHVANIHLAALKSQIDLFLLKQREILAENGLGMQRERKSSTGSTVSIKMKWLKAFKSLKGGPSNTEGYV
ncbi:tyrosine-protein kinase Fer-like protein, partial [Leptotrombidium deliense]